jgi:4'-phosphopantetheinyl transferase
MIISDPDFELPSSLPLPEKEVQLWRLDLPRLARGESRWHQTLTDDEAARAARFLVPRPREHFVMSRAWLRLLLAAYLGADAKQIAFGTSENGKPVLAPPCDPREVTFNVSHSGEVALLAFSRRRDLGVDVEQIRSQRDIEGIARRFFSAHEQKELADVVPAEKNAAFFRCWTRKEAYIKAKGKGLALPLSQFDVSLAPASTNALLATRPKADEAARWSLREVEAGPGHVGAICVDGHDWRLRDKL